MRGRPPFPFIVGSGRSGTTLVRAMLDSHPQVAVPPETYFVTELARDRSSYEAADSFATDAFLSDLLANQWFRRWDLPRKEVRAALAAPEVRSYPDAIRAVYGLFARSRGKSRYADKTPVYVYDMPLLAELFPEARFVHVIRDGRDVAASFLAQDDMRPNGVAEAALLWRERVRAGREAGAAIGEDRYLEVRHEELVTATEAALERVCDLIELDYDPAMLSYTERADELVAIDGGPARHRGVFVPPTAGLRDWRKELSAEAVETFELIAGDLLGELGYVRVADTRWAEGRPPVRLLVEEVERLRRELVTGEAHLRGKVRAARGEARKARARQQDASRGPERAGLGAAAERPDHGEDGLDDGVSGEERPRGVGRIRALARTTLRRRAAPRTSRSPRP